MFKKIRRVSSRGSSSSGNNPSTIGKQKRTVDYDDDSSNEENGDGSFRSAGSSRSDDIGSGASRNFVGSGASDSSHASDEYKQMQQFASRETKQIQLWRLLVGLSILGAGAVVATFTHNILSREKKAEHREAFDLFSNTIQDSFKFNVRSIFEANRALSRAITTVAMTTNQTFPYVSIPAFEVYGYEARHTGGIENVVYAPVVTDRQRWIRYSQEHSGWLEESKRIFDSLEPGMDRSREPPTRLEPIIWGFKENGNGGDNSMELEPWEKDEIFTPSMHMSPPPFATVMAPQNINLFTNTDYKSVSLACLVLKDAVFSSFRPQFGQLSDVNMGVRGHQEFHNTIHGTDEASGRTEIDRTLQPHSIAAQPVYKQLGRRAFSTDVGGYIYTVVAWDTYLVNLLPQGVSGVIVVLSNTCNQHVTYELAGHEARYIGEGDLHDPNYEDQKKTVTFSENYFDPSLAHQVNNHCEVYLDVYPSKEFEDAYSSPINTIMTFVVAILFVIMAALFILYDRFVQYRNTKVLGAAARSNAIVASLFPSNVRDRLMAEREEEQQRNRHGKKSSTAALRGFLSDSGKLMEGTFTDDGEMFRTKPIADLFPETTILFGDIVGFTAWSSVREPAQVFMLLETVYHAFDEIAKRRRVFKVETVGDCYVAVCGLPDPNKDHALNMCRFSRDCMHKMWEMTSKLEVTLGPDTGELSMRMGLHSGPVTAGVLRGERSRFQLFGDTMNTASRMESTGKKSFIQLSQDTADLLIGAGKDHWIHPREDRVFAKGKGEMQTYFLHVSSQLDNDNSQHSLSSNGSRTISTNLDSQLDNNNGNIHLRVLNGDGAGGSGVGVGSGGLNGGSGSAKHSKGKSTKHFAGMIGVGGESTKNFGGLMGGGRGFDKAKEKTTKRKSYFNESSEIGTNLSSKTSRLVGWNVEVLARILKQIVARRRAANKKSTIIKNSGNSNKATTNEDILKPLAGQTVLDEVAEVITLPQFDGKVAKRQEPYDSIQLSQDVTEQLRDYVTRIGAMYNDNPFHNFEHASHVTMSVVKLLSRIVAPSDLDFSEDADAAALHDHTYGITSDPLTQFSCILSALIHDADHPGVPNIQLVKEKADIAVRYKGKSVAEQNSVDISWNLLMHDRYSALRATIYSDETEMKRFRQLVVNSVMATDIVDKELKALRNARWDKAFSKESNSEENVHEHVNRKATIVIEHLIQASDVVHTMQHWHVYRKWNERFFSECYEAYKMGRAVADPSEFWYKGEMGFFDFYIIPLAKKLKDCGVFGVSSDEYLNYAMQNRKEWEDRGQDVVEQMIEKLGEKKEEQEKSWNVFDRPSAISERSVSERTSTISERTITVSERTSTTASITQDNQRGTGGDSDALLGVRSSRSSRSLT